MNYILFDDHTTRENLLPLTYTRPIAELRAGILTIREKWEKYLGEVTSILTLSYLSEKFPVQTATENILVNGAVTPNDDLLAAIRKLDEGQRLVDGEMVIACRVNGEKLKEVMNYPLSFDGLLEVQLDKGIDYLKIAYPWDIFAQNEALIKADFALITKGRTSQKLNATNTVIGTEVFVEEGAKVNCATINASSGPVYIGKDAEIMEGSIIRGAFALCDHGVLKMGAKIYGPTTVGPYSKVGGEVNNSVITGYSNKGHDGFVGNSVIGEWCNLGADTNTSNLKNNYAEVRLWNYAAGKFVKTGRQFCGLIMGDHSKCGINTMFNTGTVVGVFANIFGAGFPRNFVPSYSWGGASGFSSYRLQKAFEVGDVVMKRRNKELDDTEKAILSEVFEMTAQYRKK